MDQRRKGNQLPHNSINGLVRKSGVILLWIILWAVLAVVIDNEIFFPGPFTTLEAFVVLFTLEKFYISIGMTLLRVVGGFLVATCLAYSFAIVSTRHSWFREFIAPIVTLCKTVPLAAIVVVLLIWFGSGLLSFFVTFMVVFPNVYLNLLEGFANVPKDLLEMAKVFKMPRKNQYRYIYKPAIFPYLISALKVSLGMSFKSGVAAEVIGQTVHSIGERLYFNKIYLDTAGVFAWTIVIILLGFITEKVILKIAEKLFEIKEIKAKIDNTAQKNIKNQTNNTNTQEKGQIEKNKIEKVKIVDLSHQYQDKVLYNQLSLDFEENHIYCLNDESGAGKTTLLHLIAGLRTADAGKIEYVNSELSNSMIAMQFQEERLCGYLSAVSNILMTKELADWDITKVINLCSKVLGEKWINVPVDKLSGGMQRRTSLLRALLTDYPIILLDEPFTGQDSANKEMLIELIKTYKENRIIIIAIHEKEDIDKLGGEIISIKG